MVDMFDPLDMRTILQHGATTSLTLAVIMVYYSFVRRTYAGFNYFTAGIVSVGLGAVLISMRGVINDLFSIVIGNFFAVLMPFLFTYGLSIYLGHEWRLKKIGVALLLLFLVLLFWWTYKDPNVYARVICFSLVFGIFFTESLRITLLSSKKIFEKNEAILVLFLVFSIFTALFRVVLSLLSKSSFVFLDQVSFLFSFSTIVMFVNVVGLACSFLILNSHRMEEELLTANKKIAKIANIDGLTGIYNRRYFDQKLKIEFNRCRRSSQKLSLIFADIDFFKLYNDTYGHQQGDECLQLIASIFQLSGKRLSDVAARYGGEEFALLLPDTDTKGALKVANLIMDRVKNKKIVHESSPVSKFVTLSIGIATITPDNSVKDEAIIDLADRALYVSKRNGKNQINVQA